MYSRFYDSQVGGIGEMAELEFVMYCMNVGKEINHFIRTGQNGSNFHRTLEL